MSAELARNHSALIPLCAIICSFISPPTTSASTAAVFFCSVLFVVPAVVPTMILPSMGPIIPGLLNVDVQRTASRAGECVRADIIVICTPPFMVALVIPVAILWAIFSPLGPTRIFTCIVSPAMSVSVFSPISVVVSHFGEYERMNKRMSVVVLWQRGLG